ncbi:MAG: hypothetical protein CVU18_15420 [Betaproteobacteria bacterium HGW-Betaproteobacteria-12]|nr:MAG: hypothetical protein CVU18_15420 [Betaproteobacteria bacterium HGW-Betaproteobacteria-12]
MKTAVLLPLLLAAADASAAEALWLGRFDATQASIPAPWQIEHLDQRVAPTRYRLRQWDGVMAIEAQAKQSMALLARPLSADLQQTPILCWRWRIDAPVAAADMTKKSGDDYAARVYLSFAVPPEQLGLATRVKLRLARAIYGAQVPDAAINYVWDNRHPVGTLQDNAYTDRARMLVLRSGAAEAGRWVSERRDLAEDFRRAFGDLAGRPNGLAIATDTDNTGGEAQAGFADFHLVGRDQPCQSGSAP